MQFKYDLCDANYISYTCRHLHQRVQNTNIPLLAGSSWKNKT